MRPGTRRLLDQGGLNQDMHNAVEEGGPRNGVMTALDDFVARARRAASVRRRAHLLRTRHRRRRRAAGPEPSAGVGARRPREPGRTSPSGELAEDVRLRAAVFDQNVLRNVTGALERSRDAHLRLLKDALLDRHYLENEVRLSHLGHRIRSGRPINVGHLRDPVRYDRARLRSSSFASASARAGQVGPALVPASRRHGPCPTRPPPLLPGSPPAGRTARRRRRVHHRPGRRIGVRPGLLRHPRDGSRRRLGRGPVPGISGARPRAVADSPSTSRGSPPISIRSGTRSSASTPSTRGCAS